MQIVIPMTGYGSRFKAAGFQELKPFIQVHNKPMVEWVVKMFPDPADKITFICRKEHMDELSYVEPTIRRVAPDAEIFTIDDWEKKGPVNDVMRASSVIKDDEPVIVCYCDYYMQWDYSEFKKLAQERDCDGAVPCYTGFHPHLLPEKNLYASCKIDSEENLTEIKEKFSWEKDKKKTRHSAGLYYFKSGQIMKKFFQQTIDTNDHLNGEFYASLPYNHLVKAGLKVWCPANVEKFCQWGTPEDMREYLFWTDTIRSFEL